jgi:hypothetical protein
MPTTLIDTPVYLHVDAGGSSLDTNLLGATTQHTYDAQLATATIEYAEDPGSPPYNTPIQVFAGTGAHNAVRFTGRFKRKRFNLWPQTYSMVCKGVLSYAKEYQQQQRDSDLNGLGTNGLVLPEILGTTIAATDNVDPSGWSVPPTDQNIIKAVLASVPQLSGLYNPADIGGTGRHFGVLSLANLTWRNRQDALSYCLQFDQVCLGYRLYELRTGRIVRTQIYGYPSQTADQLFTQGVDIFELGVDRDVDDLINAMLVHGFQLGGTSLAIRALEQASNPLQPYAGPGDQVYSDTFDNALIEQPEPGGANFLSAREVAQWKLTERNKERVGLRLVTYLDAPVSPGRSIAVNAPNAGVTEAVWVRGVTCTVRTNPQAFIVQYDGDGGGIFNPDGSDVDAWGNPYVLPPAA